MTLLIGGPRSFGQQHRSDPLYMDLRRFGLLRVGPLDRTMALFFRHIVPMTMTSRWVLGILVLLPAYYLPSEHRVRVANRRAAGQGDVWVAGPDSTLNLFGMMVT